MKKARYRILIEGTIDEGKEENFSELHGLVHESFKYDLLAGVSIDRLHVDIKIIGDALGSSVSTQENER